MATIKAFTDLEQSKKLAKILPITSIDFAWNIFSDGSTKLLRMDDWEVSENARSNVEIIPCWSLSALLSVLPNYELNNFGNAIQLSVKNEALETEGDETLLDLVVNMIIYLHERKML